MMLTINVQGQLLSVIHSAPSEVQCQLWGPLREAQTQILESPSLAGNMEH